VEVNVVSRVFGNDDISNELPKISFKNFTDTISIRDLIARSVELQIDILIDQHERSKTEIQALLDKQFLEDKDIQEQANSGKIALERPKLPTEQAIDVSVEIDRAIQSFVLGRFKIFANGTEHTDLEQEIYLGNVIEVKLIRIMPLVGG